MGRLNNFKLKLKLCKMIIAENDKPIKVMNCQNCGEVFFDTVEVIEDDHEYYNAVYKCKKCGAIVHELQMWKGVEYEIRSN